MILDLKIVGGLLLLTPLILSVLACGDTSAADPTEPGVIFNFAGGGEGFDQDAATKEDARFGSISGLSVAGDWLYVADNGSHVISRINILDRRFELIAGTGQETGSILETAADMRQAPLPPINSISVDPVSNQLYVVFTERPDIRNTALVQIDMNSGVLNVLLRDTSIKEVRVLNETQLLFSKGQELFRYDLAIGKARRILPGVEIRTFAVGPEQMAYLFTSDSEPVILKLDFTDPSSVDVVAGPFDTNPLLGQVRDDVELLVDPELVVSNMAVSTDGRVAVIDDSKYGSTIGLLIEGSFTVAAGTGPIDDTGDGGPATDATIRPGDIVFDQAGNLYLNNRTRIRRINQPSALN